MCECYRMPFIDRLEFILPNSYCAVAPDSSSPDIWYIKIINTETNLEITDDYRNMIAPRQYCIESRIKVEVLAKGFLFKLSKKKTYFLPIHSSQASSNKKNRRVVVCTPKHYNTTLGMQWRAMFDILSSALTNFAVFIYFSNSILFQLISFIYLDFCSVLS